MESVKIIGQICESCGVLVNNYDSDVLCPNCEISVWAKTLGNEVFEVSKEKGEFYKHNDYVMIQ